MDDRELKPWRLIGAAVQGRSHIKTGTRCQDSLRYALVGDTAIAAISDGAGSADLAHLGSSIAVDAAVTVLATSTRTKTPNLDDLRHAFASARDAVDADATERERPVRDYACTLLLALASPKQTLFAQIGDGAIVGVSRGNQVRPLSWPQQGEYANATVFLVQKEIEPVFSEEEPLNAFALFSDGLQSVALEYTSRTAYAPFFAPFFSALHLSNENLPELERHLITYLENDQQLGSRTDDDLSLIVGVRI